VAIAPASDDMALSFFSPQVLAGAVNFLSNLAGNGALPLYLLCADGALLRYSLRRHERQALNSEAERSDRSCSKAPPASPTTCAGSRTKGDLYVRVRSTVWGKEQSVTAQWQPKAAPWPAQDNPHFLSFAGRCSVMPTTPRAGPKNNWAASRAANTCGAVLAPPKARGLVALEPVEDHRAWLVDTISQLFWFGHLGFDITPDHPLFFYTIKALQAFYKVIPLGLNLSALDQRLLDNFADKNDLRLYLDIIRSNRPVAESVYLACRGGALLKYVPGLTADETRLLSVDSSPSPSVLVSGLRAAGTLSVLETDTFWTATGGRWGRNGRSRTYSPSPTRRPCCTAGTKTNFDNGAALTKPAAVDRPVLGGT